MTPLLSASVRAPAEARRLGREDASQGLQSSKTDKQTMFLHYSGKRSVGRGCGRQRADYVVPIISLQI